MKAYEIFKNKNWYFEKYDARKKIFKGISIFEFEEAKLKHSVRFCSKHHASKNDIIEQCRRRHEDLMYWNSSHLRKILKETGLTITRDIRSRCRMDRGLPFARAKAEIIGIQMIG